MAAIITSASAQFALEHQKVWSKEHNLTNHPHHGQGHRRCLSDHDLRSHSDHDLHHVENRHHLGDSLSHLCWGGGHLQQRSHSDYLFHGEKHGRCQGDHRNHSPGLKRHINSSRGDEVHHHRDKKLSSQTHQGYFLSTGHAVRGHGNHGELQGQGHRNYEHHYVNHKVWYMNFEPLSPTYNISR